MFVCDCFNMSDLSTELYLTEKSYTFSFKVTSIESIALNWSDMLPWQNWFYYQL